MAYSIRVTPETLTFASVDQRLEVTIQNLNDFDVAWSAKIPVKPTKPLMVVPPSKGILNAKEQTTLIVSPHPSNPPARKEEGIRFEFEGQNVVRSKYTISVPVHRPFAPANSPAMSNSDVPPEMSSSTTLDANSNIASPNTAAPASPGPANPPATPSVTSQPAVEVAAPPQPQPAQPPVESEQKDEGFNMATLIPLAVACIVISFLQTASIKEVPLFGSLYSPWTTFMLGIATAYVTYRIINPRRQLSVVHMKTQ